MKQEQDQLPDQHREVTESEVRDRYGISPDAYLQRRAVALHKSATLLYAACFRLNVRN